MASVPLARKKAPPARRELAISRAILQATLRTTTDAILVSRARASVIEFSESFAAMWAVPAPLLKEGSLEKLMAHVELQLPDAAAFRRSCDDIYAHPERSSEDTLHLLDGRVIERHSNPLRLARRFIGRVWSFSDVTQERRVEAALRTETHVLELLNTVGHNLTSKLDLAGVVRAVIAAGTDVSGGAYGAFIPEALRPAPAVERYLRASCGDARRFLPLRRELEQALGSGAVPGNRQLCINDLSCTSKRGSFPRRGGSPLRAARSMVFMPVISRTGETLGGLLFVHESAGAFTPRTVDILGGLAAQAAVAIDNNLLYARLKKQVSELRVALRLQRSHLRSIRSVSRRLMRLEEEQGKRLGRELHDRVGANISALLLGVELIRKESQGKSHPLLDARLGAFGKTLHDTLDDVKHLLAGLRPVCLDEFGLLSALRHRADELTGGTEVEFVVTGEDPSPRLSPECETAFFRIAQEAWNNVLKHAHASRAVLTLARKGRAVSMQIDDDGTGILSVPSSARGPSLGLTTMRERAEAIGAVLDIGPSTTMTGVRLRLVCARARPATQREKPFRGAPRT